MSDFREKNQWRIHPIDWNGRNVPLNRKDLYWIDRKYMENEDEFPFYQFQITTGTGRVIGFWDEVGLFNIVFLDTMHNMQPSQYNDYKLRETTIARGEMAVAISLVESAISSCGERCGCRGMFPRIQSALTHTLPFETMLVPMAPDLFDRVSRCIADGWTASVSDLLHEGLSSLGYDGDHA